MSPNVPLPVVYAPLVTTGCCRIPSLVNVLIVTGKQDTPDEVMLQAEDAFIEHVYGNLIKELQSLATKIIHHAGDIQLTREHVSELMLLTRELSKGKEPVNVD